MLLPVLLMGIVDGKNYTQLEISKAWIKVPWSNGGHYWHNIITREDRDEL
tara:strand:- start:5150 stop:5299 length:150 start_codon:yes stop_codon:yes gene_type:complete